MPEEITSLSLRYAATLLRKLIAPSAEDPAAGDFARLTGPMLEIALAVYGEGGDKLRRHARLKAEATARGLEILLEEVTKADSQANLADLDSSNWKPFDLVDVLKEEIPPIRWLVKPYLYQPGVTVFFGRPKSLKSLLVLDLVVHLAGGKPWLCSAGDKQEDGFLVNRTKVVWVDLENGSVTLKRRLKALGLTLGLGEDERGQLLAYSMPSPWPDLSKPENTAALITRINDLGNVGVLVIDHLSQIFGAVDENSPLASQIMAAVRSISEACGVAVVLIHHARKSTGKGGGLTEDQLRGSGAILAGVDAAFMVERDRGETSQVKIIPVAVRGPDAPNASAQFSYEQDENLDLLKARFWRMAWRSDYMRARDAVLTILRDGSKNQTALRAAVKAMEPSVSDQTIRDAIVGLEGTQEITFKAGNKGAKVYRLAGQNELED